MVKMLRLGSNLTQVNATNVVHVWGRNSSEEFDLIE